MRPWRLRDCRRWLDAGHRTGYALWQAPRCRFSGISYESPLGLVLRAVGAYEVYPSRPQARALDQLISRFGPDALVDDVVRALREQAERTDHKVGPDAPISTGPHTNADAATHGGDGNSGECEHAASTSADDRHASDSASAGGAAGDTPDGQSSCGVAGCDASSGSPEHADGASPTDGEGTPTGRGDIGADEATGEMGAHLAIEDAPAADETATGNGCSAQGTGAGDDEDHHARAYKAAGDAESPGDRHESGSRSAAVASYADVRRIARMARALSRLVAEATRPETTPLWDGRRVVSELVSRQVRLHRMRQDMRTPRAVLVLYDVSGSCSWNADATWAVASALADRYPAILAAPTSGSSLLVGGMLCATAEGSLVTAEIVGHGQIAAAARRLPPIVDSIGYGDDLHGWKRLRSVGVSHILVLGDAHGVAGYRAAARAGIRVLWANPNPDIAPDDTAWCTYTIIMGTDIASAVEALTRRSLP